MVYGTSMISYLPISLKVCPSYHFYLVSSFILFFFKHLTLVPLEESKCRSWTLCWSVYEYRYKVWWDGVCFCIYVKPNSSKNDAKPPSVELLKMSFLLASVKHGKYPLKAQCECFLEYYQEEYLVLAYINDLMRISMHILKYCCHLTSKISD